MQKANRQRPMAAFSTTNHELRINTHELQATSFNYEPYKPYELNGPNKLYEPRATGYELPTKD